MVFKQGSPADPEGIEGQNKNGVPGTVTRSPPTPPSSNATQVEKPDTASDERRTREEQRGAKDAGQPAKG